MSKNLYDLIPDGGAGCNEYLLFYLENSSNLNDDFSQFNIENLEDFNAIARDVYEDEYDLESFSEYIYTLKAGAEDAKTLAEWINIISADFMERYMPLTTDLLEGIIKALEDDNLVK